MVEAIFGVEEGPRFLAVLRAAFREHADIAAGAEAAALAMVDDDRLDRVVIAPREQRIDHRFAHREVERVDRLGTIERNARSEEHTSELQSLMRSSYAVFCLKKKKKLTTHTISVQIKE